MQKPALYDIIKTEEFRRRIFSSFGNDFAFWISETGKYSKSIDLGALARDFLEAQKRVRAVPRPDASILRGDDGYNAFRQMAEGEAAAWQPYCAKKLQLLLDALPRDSAPRVLGEVMHDPVDFALQKRLVKRGAYGLEEWLGRPMLGLADALVLNRLSRNVVCAKISHAQDLPSPAYLGLFQQSGWYRDDADVAMRSHILAFTSMFDPAQKDSNRKVYSWYAITYLLLHPEEGLLEHQGDVNKVLAKFY